MYITKVAGHVVEMDRSRDRCYSAAYMAAPGLEAIVYERNERGVLKPIYRCIKKIEREREMVK